MMFAGCVLGAAGTLLASSGGLPTLSIGLMIVGLAQVTVSIGTQVETIHGAARQHVAHAVALYFFLSSISQIVGPGLGALLVRGADYRTAFLGAAGLAIVALLATINPARRRITPDAMVARPPALETIAEALGRRPAARAALLVSLSGDLTAAFWSTFFPLLLTTRGYGPQAVALYFSLRAITNTGVRPLIGAAIARFNPTRLMVFSLAGTALSLAAMPLLIAQISVGIAVLLFGLAGGVYTTLAAIDVATAFPAEAAGVGVGMRMLMSRIGIIVGPILLGLAVQSLGYTPAFVLGAMLCGAPALLYTAIHRRSLARRPQTRPLAAGEESSDGHE
jgi:predicted MFS family arabinose efflux permease